MSITLTKDCIKALRVLVPEDQVAPSRESQVSQNWNVHPEIEVEVSRAADTGRRSFILQIAYVQEGTIYTNLLLNGPTWARGFSEFVKKDGIITLLIHGDQSTLQALGETADAVMNHKHALDRFHTSSRPRNDRYSAETFHASPMRQPLIGFEELNAFSQLREYMTAQFAGAMLECSDELTRNAAYETGPKNLVLVESMGGEDDRCFFGVIDGPGENGPRFQTGDKLTIKEFLDIGVEPDGYYLAWKAVIIEPLKISPERTLSLLVYRGEGKDEDNQQVFDNTHPDIINPEGMNDRQLANAIEELNGNRVTIKVDTFDNTVEKMSLAYNFLHRISHGVRPDDLTKGEEAYSQRMIQVVLGRRPDLLDFKDWCQHIRYDISNPMEVMRPLNDKQQEVVLASQRLRGGLQVIQGPPGTGKSFLLQQMILPFFLTEKKTTVLVAAPTNNGANDLAQEIRKGLDEMRLTSPHARGRYIIRLYKQTTEQAISQTPSENVSDLGSAKRGGSGSDQNAADPELEGVSKQIHDEFKAAETFKYEGVEDKHVQDITLSAGHMALCITGVLAGTPNENSTIAAKYTIFKNLAGKARRNEYLSPNERTQLRGQFKQLLKEVITGASVIVGTTARITMAQVLDTVQHQVSAVFLDENAHESEYSLAPLFAARFSLDPCIVLIGDQDQLAPHVETTTRQAEGENIKNAFAPQLALSFMARMVNIGMEYVMLTEQHRMVEDIAYLPSTLTYRNQLTNTPSTALAERPIARKFQQFAEALTGRKSNRIMINVPPSETNVTKTNDAGSKANEYLLCVVAEILDRIAWQFEANTTIAILTPYLYQKACYLRMKSKMKQAGSPLADSITIGALQDFDKLTIGTFDGSQGRQFDIVIVDLPVAESIGFLADKRRMNVAITRARNGLVLVCDVRSIELAGGNAPYLRKLIQQFRGRTYSREKDDKIPVTDWYTPAEV